MLNLLIDWTPFETTIKKNKISMELKPLSNEAMLVLAPIMAQDLNKNDKVALYKETFNMQKMASSVLPAHARNLTGIIINDKAPTWKQIAEEAALAELACIILGQLFKISSLSEIEVKN